MEQKFHQNHPWSPKGAKSKIVHRHNLCDLMKICRKKSQSLDHSPYKESLQDCVKLLHQFLGCSRNIPRTCRCREPSKQDSPAAFLWPLFQFLGGRSPFELFNEFFFQLESIRCWHRLVTEIPWLQDLLAVSHAGWMPGPPMTCLSCQERQTAESLDGSSVGKSQKCQSHCMMCRRSQEHQRDFPGECLYNMNQRENKDFTKNDLQSDQSLKRGPLASIRELKNSLKTDLEQHQIYFADIESRLSGLERRAEDVTRNLEKANLELKAIKRGSVTLKTLVDQQMSSLVRDHLEKLEERDLQVLDSLWDDWWWSEDTLRTERSSCHVPQPNKLRRTEDPPRRHDAGYPADGSSGYWRSIQSGISLCQDQVNVLIQQITRQINQTVSDLNFTLRPEETEG
ncbi:uncharacterized protein LOC142139657 [Mixophyes fleayi]|uniref:uncharacterized protein LOC142139657 n=1 Tax=Mixophyes fleayi TaxID=3061075 RepID=UPI003F4DAFA9